MNYRDSKLTRILQPCLGGNARTAIICTLSPAREHVEQSKNTLLFASCAKEVTTNAQVNVVMSDKALVKHLQKELARLENELRTPAPPDYSALLKKKDQQIEKVWLSFESQVNHKLGFGLKMIKYIYYSQLEKEVRDLIKQRDLAESRIKELLQAVRNDQTSTQWVCYKFNVFWRDAKFMIIYNKLQKIWRDVIKTCFFLIILFCNFFLLNLGWATRKHV